jgi:hypothetical protein
MNPLISLGLKGFDPVSIDSQAQANMLQQGQLEAQRQQMAVNQLALQKDQRGEERRGRLNQLLATVDQDPTPNHTINRLMQNGFVDEAKGLRESFAKSLESESKSKLQGSQSAVADQEVRLKRLEVGKKVSSYVAQTSGALLERPDLTPQMAAQAFVNLANDYPGFGDPQRLQSQIDQMLQMNTDDLRRFLKQKQLESVDTLKQLEMQKLDVRNVNVGGKTVTQGVNPYSGEVRQLNEMTNTNSPDAVLADGRMRSEGAANRAITARGQNMTDARSRDNASMAMSKPFEVTGPDGQPLLVQQDKAGNIKPVTGFSAKTAAEKPLTEGQAKALSYASRMQAADVVIGKLAEEGTTTSTPFSRAPIVGGAINAVNSESKQKLDQAKRDFVNAVLRRESGAVISDSEFNNAEKQYFPQIGDSKGVIAQKKENRRISLEGIKEDVPKQKRSRVDEISAPIKPQFKILGVE